MVALGKFVFRFRNWLFPLIWVAFFAAFQPTLAFGSPLGTKLLDLAGLVVILGGLGTRILTIGLVNIPREGKRKRVSARSLAREGLFRHVRNPLYVGNVLLFAGWLLIFHNPWAYALGLPLVVLAYQAIIRAEEAFLEEGFGAEFRQYRAEVNRWLPGPRGLARTLREDRLDTGRILAKEYNAVLLWFSMAFLAMTYERLVLAGVPLSVPFVLEEGFILGILSGVSAFIVFLKRKKVLSGKGWVAAGTD